MQKKGEHFFNILSHNEIQTARTIRCTANVDNCPPSYNTGNVDNNTNYKLEPWTEASSSQLPFIIRKSKQRKSALQSQNGSIGVKNQFYRNKNKFSIYFSAQKLKNKALCPQTGIIGQSTNSYSNSSNIANLERKKPSSSFSFVNTNINNLNFKFKVRNPKLDQNLYRPKTIKTIDLLQIQEGTGSRLKKKLKKKLGKELVFGQERQKDKDRYQQKEQRSLSKNRNLSRSIQKKENQHEITNKDKENGASASSSVQMHCQLQSNHLQSQSHNQNQKFSKIERQLEIERKIFLLLSKANGYSKERAISGHKVV